MHYELCYWNARRELRVVQNKIIELINRTETLPLHNISYLLKGLGKIPVLLRTQQILRLKALCIINKEYEIINSKTLATLGAAMNKLDHFLLEPEGRKVIT